MPRILLLLLAVTLPIAAAEPAADRALLIDAEQAFAQDRPAEALRLVDQYLAKSPDDAKAHLLRGAIRDQSKDYAKSIPDYTKAIALDPNLAPAFQRRGVARFMAGQVDESIKDFDRYLELRPDERPHHWQRGIALYYAGRYEDGARQFELHRTVNPEDVENAAWHFLCLARWKDVDTARKSLIPIKDDARVPMARIHQLFAGQATPDDVLKAATDNPRHLFYAHLYLGLYYESIKQPEKAREHLTLAAEKYPVPDYMHGVAQVHLQRLKNPN
jgi:lipoprotein NlpI